MAMGKKQARGKQEDLFYASERTETPGHPFYEQLNRVLEEAKFDAFCEERCGKFYHAKVGRPSLAPGVYFRLLLIGYFEGIASERGIGWRVADSLSLRRFLSYGLDEATPDHVTISRTRRLLDEGTHQAVFTFVLAEVARRGMLKGKTIGIDATTLEANAAMRSIIRRDTGESYMEYLRRLATEAGIDSTDDAAVRRMDRRRKKKTPNDEWMNPHDRDAEVTKMKNGATHLAYKVEQAVDLETGAIVAITTQGGAVGDTTSVQETLPAAGFAVAEQIATPTAQGQYKVWNQSPGGLLLPRRQRRARSVYRSIFAPALILFAALPIGQAAGSRRSAGGIKLLLQIADVGIDQLAQFRNLERQFVGANLILLHGGLGGMAGGSAQRGAGCLDAFRDR
jgi:transposase